MRYIPSQNHRSRRRSNPLCVLIFKLSTLFIRRKLRTHDMYLGTTPSQSKRMVASDHPWGSESIRKRRGARYKYWIQSLGHTEELGLLVIFEIVDSGGRLKNWDIKRATRRWGQALTYMDGSAPWPLKFCRTSLWWTPRNWKLDEIGQDREGAHGRANLSCHSIFAGERNRVGPG